MTLNHMKIAIYGREFQPSVIPYVQQLFDFLVAKNAELHIFDKFYQFLDGQGLCQQGFHTYSKHEQLTKDFDFMLSLGGDGTMLAAVSIVGNSGIPVAGINFGRLGFLASINKDDIEKCLKEILAGQYQIEKRVLLSVKSPDSTLFGAKHFALNDITVFKYDSSAMITVEAYLDGQFLNSYWSDGLIVATPTGSTAYSLSCGGPIITPGSNNFVVTPMSPHNLNVRPVVISGDSVLELKIDSRSERYLLTCDSRTKTLDTSVRLIIRRADFEINLIRLQGDEYFETLRNKLLWGLDARNY